MATATPNARFMVLGKSKYVHVVYTKAYDLKHSQCQMVRKMVVADKINPKDKGISADAAGALDPCPHCDTAGVLSRTEPPEVKRQRAKDKAAETMDKIKDSTKTKAQQKKAAKVKATKAPRVKGDKPTKARGTRSTGESTKEKADALTAFAIEHGWSAKTVEVKGEPGLAVRATRGQELINCWFVDGKYDTSRHATLTVGSWTGKLRGVHGCRKQMAGEGRDRPHPKPGAGRSAPRKGKDEVEEDAVPEDESPEDAHRRVPFSMDDEAVVIIDAVKGKALRWRNGVSGVVEEATLPADCKGTKRDKITVTEHPKTGRRMINFLTVAGMSEHGEVYGPERTVALEKIVRVVG